MYWTFIKKLAAELGSDGCTGVPDFYLEACLEHDVHYRTHMRFALNKKQNGLMTLGPITRAEADLRMRQEIQRRSYLGILSPMSWWRWTYLLFRGKDAWIG